MVNGRQYWSVYTRIHEFTSSWYIRAFDFKDVRVHECTNARSSCHESSFLLSPIQPTPTRGNANENVKRTLNRTRRMYSHTDVRTGAGVGDGSQREHQTKTHTLASDPRDLSKPQTVCPTRLAYSGEQGRRSSTLQAYQRQSQ